MNEQKHSKESYLKPSFDNQLKTSMQEQHKSTYAVYAVQSAIRIRTSNCIMCVKIVNIGLQITEL